MNQRKITLAAAMLVLGFSVADAQQIAEVTVTAQRKTENVQDVPMSISVLTTTDLQNRHIEQVENVLMSAPNIIGNNNLGSQTALSIFIRGVGTTENLATADPAIGLYVDDVYTGRQAINNLSLYDIESIEVLRGPQGVLYGRNTNGGAIKVNTVKPNSDYHGQYDFSYGSFNYFDTKLVGNAPITDNLFVRGSFVWAQDDGYMTALNKSVNNIDHVSGRVALRYLTDSLDAIFTTDYSDSTTNGNFIVDIGGLLQPKPTNLFNSRSSTDALNTSETIGTTLNVKYVLPIGELQSITGYRETNQYLTFDASGQPLSLYNIYQNQNADQVSQEFQLTSSVGGIDFVTGLYFFNEKTNAYVMDELRQPASLFNVASFITKNFTVEVNNYALYGQAEYNWNDYTVAVGGRYTQEDKQLDLVQNSTIPGVLYNYSRLSEREFNKFTPKVSLSRKLENGNVYLSYAEGFRSGGWAGRAFRADQYVTFNPENVETIEAGIKLESYNWRLNTALFNTKYTNLFNTLTLNGAFTVQTADATIRGLETEGQLLVNDWLTLYGSVGLLDGEYDNPRPRNLASELQRTPNYQAKLGATVSFPAKSGKVVLNANGYYVDEYLLTPANLAFTAPSLANKNLDVSGKYAVLNASATYNISTVDITLQCTNCLDKQYVEGAVYIGQYAGAWAGMPRIVKLSISERF
jgi:iron complex outermembrane receptor protein